MGKDRVYSWRLDNTTRTELERAARRANLKLSSLLDSIVRGWLETAHHDGMDAAEQTRLHEAAARCSGVLHGGDPHRAENARRIIRGRLAKRYGRGRSD